MIRQTFFRRQIGLMFAAAMVFVGALSVAGQSTSLDYPTPITGNQLSGSILARDIGDSRVTRHFYLLSGTTGDLTITVQYSNLNGDVDLFTANGMRPLAKIGLVASDNLIKVDRTVFLRVQENLILRVEAKSSNDDPGRYQISFSGTFEPIASAAEAPPPPTVDPKSTSTNRRRVTTAGEVIIEPEPEPVAKVEPPPKPVPASVNPPAKPKTRPARGTTTPTTRSTPTTTGGGGTTARAPRKPRTVKPKTPTATSTTPPADENTAETPPATPPSKPAPRRPVTRRNTARTTTSTPATPPAPKPEPAPDPMANARLVVETRDGGHQEHYMRDVRRFTVEKGILLVILKDGKIERQPMSNVLRVVIEP